MKAMITGATSGIGWATAESLAAAGYSLLLLGRREERLHDLQQKLSRLYPQKEFRTAQVDITERNQVDELIQNETNFLSELDVLVNNAGLAKGVDKMQEAALADWDVMIDTNIKGLLAVTRGVLEFMVAKKSGHIVNLGSVAGRWTYPGGGVYCATKFAVRALSEGLRMDLLGTNIRVTNIEPGMVNTEFSLVRTGDQTKADAVYANMTPLSAKDIADTITWCVQRPSHVNIQELVIYPTDQAHVGQVYRGGR